MSDIDAYIRHRVEDAKRLERMIDLEAASEYRDLDREWFGRLTESDVRAAIVRKVDEDGAEWLEENWGEYVDE